ncbi:hypothetical protein PVAND_008231 [Polypedilum vanderplanki]|uniref:Death-inducer obliterator 1 n=1 Tax=Polypedilum vanderplanki TaxID=319348 RepID=A0A9J6C9K5_POLVA|nr:hypothetical protein PVAND_008231 [Polypedilum vanderplanki]
MSHSNFKIIANDEPINRNLVIIVNKNGDVGTDTVALQTLLTSKETPRTGVTVIRETSPTPSISDEIEEDRQENNEILRQQYIMEHPNANEEEIEQQIRKISELNDIPHVTLNVENFYTPDQARKFANDVLHLGGIDNPQTLVPIDYNFRRQIIQNDHCYTPLTMSPEPNEKSSIKHSKAKELKINKKEGKITVPKARQVAKEIIEEYTSDSNESADGENDENLEEEQSAEEEEISFSESDDDNDMDFSVNDRFGKKGKKKRKYRKHKQKSMTFKDFLEGGDPSSMDEEPKKKYGKVSKKSSKILDAKPSTSGKVVSNQVGGKNTQQNIAIRKIQMQSQSKGSITKKELPTMTQVNNNTVKTISSATTSAISNISIQSAAPAKSNQEIEFVESIVKDLEKSFPDNSKEVQQQSSSTTIPNIMQMMETNTPTEVIDQSLSTLEQMDSADGAVGIDEIGDALIAVLGNDAIDELLNQGDLMNFDASTTTTGTTASSSVKSAQNIVSSSSQIQQSVNTSAQQFVSSDIQISPTTSKTLTQMPKILNRETTPVKDGIKVVRNGRIITLPPIEAPATRGAKRRAQGDTTPSTLSPLGKMIKTEKASSNKDPDSRNSSRRSSLNKSESGRSSRRQSTTQGNADDENDIDSDASWNSEDDPDRLWCICKQPHNNRFMICCDKCEEWFHGTCVNVTKNMGKEMEKQDIKWHCPNCKSNASGTIKKDPNKKTLNQQKLTKFFSKHLKESTDEDIPKNTGSRLCVVCHQNPARPDSIYCSEDCICNHANKHLDESSPQPKTPTNKTSSEISGRPNVLKDKSGNVIVYDRVTGKLLSSKLWPHFTSLGQWLSQNPNCEPVKPGSSQAKQLKESVNKKNTLFRQTSLNVITSTSQTTPTASVIKNKHITSGDDLFSNPVKINTGAKDSPTIIPTKKSTPTQQNQQPSSSVHSVKNSSSVKPHLNKSTNSPLSPALNKPSTPKSAEPIKKFKKQEPEEKQGNKTSSGNSKAKPESERTNVRNNFKTTLKQRMNEFDHPTIAKMTDEEIDKFATAVESEMFIFFNKDTKDKYKNKFRSLRFNLSDTKNKTLLEKICAKKLSPKQLVQLPPAALASEELSKWREDENKHQLEIITKSELDALSQNKIVLKTHKGEEILETKSDPVNISLPDENDIESVIKGTVLSVDDPLGKYDRSISLNVSTGQSVNSPLSSPSISSSTGRKSDSYHHHSRSRSKSRGRDHHHHKSSKHKKNERHRSRSPKHHHHSSSSHHSRDKSRGERSRDRSHEKDRDYSKKRTDDHKSHHRDKSRSNENDKSTSKTKDHHHHHKEGSFSSKDSKRHHHQKEVKQEKGEIKPEKIEIKPEQEDVDIVGKILDSMGVHLDTKPKTDVKDDKTENSSKSEVSSSFSDSIAPLKTTDPLNEHQLEIEIYSGNMYMADVTKFDVTASIVSGNVDDITKYFMPQLEIVGRIEPKTVWDYLGKVKKLPGKELVVLRFSSSDQSAYFTLFSYLHSRQRYGVIKSPSIHIKDFYVITVEASRPLPQVLLPIVGPGFVEGEEHKPDLLLGVILKILPESKHQLKKPVSNIKKTLKTSRTSIEHNVPIQILPTKHKSHSKLTVGLPDVGIDDVNLSPKKSYSTLKDDDDDEPYTPFDDEDSLTEPPIFNTTTTPVSTAPSGSRKHNLSGEDLESEMEKLEREIEQRQNEIQTLAKQKALELDEEQASKIFEKISVPHNLSEILSTIKASEPKSMEIDNEEEYIPMSTEANSLEYRPSSSYVSNISQQQPPIVNSMMDIDERINLFRQEMPSINNLPITSPSEQPSRLALMSDADLMKLVPDDALEAPPPPMISNNDEPPIPGLD